MEKEGYKESMPPIYMNLVNITMAEDPQEAMKLIDKALELAEESSPQRVFDIETRRTLAYYTLGDTANFVKGYKAYKEGVANGLNSVHGRQLEIHWLASHGQTDEAVKLATDVIDNPYETQAEVYAKAGRWREAFDALKKGTEQSDSINSFILKSSMEGIENELKMYEVRRQQSRVMLYSMVIVISLLLLLIAALVYIVQSRRRHWRQMEAAYRHVIEAEKVKTDFIQNVSHEVRTPLNIISGFAQVLASPDNKITPEERSHISQTMLHNTRLITTMVSEVLEISRGDAIDTEIELKPYQCNELIRQALNYFCTNFFRPQEVLHYESSLPDDFMVRSHAVILQRILNPLIDNAYKNIPAEGGSIVVRTEATDDQLEIFIEDNGPGIPEKDAERVFERFVKLDSFKEGMGLGLTFSRTMARRMGGDVVLDTTYAGSGARFKVTLPI
jgi:signal transduction histidine kinase